MFPKSWNNHTENNDRDAVEKSLMDLKCISRYYSMQNKTKSPVKEDQREKGCEGRGPVCGCGEVGKQKWR